MIHFNPTLIFDKKIKKYKFVRVKGKLNGNAYQYDILDHSRSRDLTILQTYNNLEDLVRYIASTPTQHLGFKKTNSDMFFTYLEIYDSNGNAYCYQRNSETLWVGINLNSTVQL